MTKNDLIFDEKNEWIRDLPIWFNKLGRACVTIGYKNYFIHHIVLPRKSGFDVDHINGNKLDNRECNLRYATRSQNIFNKKRRSDSTQLYKGIQMLPSGRFRAKGPNGKHLGTFDTPEEAFNCFLEFSKIKYGEEFVNKSMKNITGGGLSH